MPKYHQDPQPENPQEAETLEKGVYGKDYGSCCQGVSWGLAASLTLSMASPCQLLDRHEPGTELRDLTHGVPRPLTPSRLLHVP